MGMLKEIEEWISPLKQSLEDGAEFVFSDRPEHKALQYELLEMRHYTRVAVGWLEEIELTLIKKIRDKKLSTSIEALTKGYPEEFAIYMNYCRSLKIEEKPDIGYLRKLFKDLFYRMGYE